MDALDFKCSSNDSDEWLSVVIQELVDGSPGGHAVRGMSRSARDTFDGINKRLCFHKSR